MPFPKVNVIVQQDFELTYFKAPVENFNHYASGTHIQQIEQWYQIGFIVIDIQKFSV